MSVGVPEGIASRIAARTRESRETFTDEQLQQFHEAYAAQVHKEAESMTGILTLATKELRRFFHKFERIDLDDDWAIDKIRMLHAEDALTAVCAIEAANHKFEESVEDWCNTACDAVDRTGDEIASH